MLEARLSDAEVVNLFSRALDSIVGNASCDSGLLAAKDARDLYPFVANYFQQDGTVVTASDLKKRFDEKLTPALNDYLFCRYHSAIDTQKRIVSYGGIPAAALAVGVSAQFLGYEIGSSIAFGAAFISGLGLIGRIITTDRAVRHARDKATADASGYINSLPVEKFEYLLGRAAEKYKHLLVVG